MPGPGVIVTERAVGQHSGLPAEMSSLVGRGPQLAAVLDGLRAARVVTLTGPGGCGKTRLALRAATLAGGGFEDGARLVELASLADPALVPVAVAAALGVPEQDAANPMAGVVRALADRELLIVLDNCEHVLASAGRVAAMLAGQCRRVRILATSRERLDVPGEFVFPVPPLELPEDGSAHAIAASEAGSLFITRARAASPGFLLAGLAWHAGDADRIVAELESSRALSGVADPALAARAQVLLTAAAFLAGDLAEHERHGRRAVELARTAAGQEGLALALTMWSMSAIAGAGIEPATVAALDEAATVLAAHPDRFAETIMRRLRTDLFATLGQLDAGTGVSSPAPST